MPLFSITYLQTLKGYDSDGVWKPNANYVPRMCRACGELRRYCECGAEHSASGSESECESDSSEDYRNVSSIYDIIDGNG